MKARILTVLILLNVLIFGFGLFFLNKPSLSHENKEVAKNLGTRLKSSRSNRASHLSKVAAPSPVTNLTSKFHWSQIESSDYREYIKNLRSIGCPESTIKDIIMTDIMRLYAARRGQFYQNGREFRFWETNEKRKLNARQLEEREKQLALIDKEIPAVLRELLGINYEREINKYFVDANEDEQRLSFLPGNKRNQVLALREEMEGLKEQLLAEFGGDTFSEEYREASHQIEKKRQEKLAKILTAAELEEFELRTSETADRLREVLIGFNPSEEEFRQLYILQKSLVATEEDKPEATEQIEAEFRARIGEERYAEYLRAKSPEFRSACLFTELYELPDSTANTIFEIQQIAQREKQNLLSNLNIPAERRLEVLESIRAETEQSLQEILGAKILSNYTQTSGKWVEELSAPN